MDTQRTAIETTTAWAISLRKRRVLVWVAGVILATLILGFLLTLLAQGGGPSAGGRRPTVTVGVAAATQGNLPIQLDALGTVTPVTTVTVTPRVTGTILSVNFKEGDLVRQGQVLAEIDPRPYQAALQQAQGQLVRDQAALQNSRLDLERDRTLLSEDSIARQQVDTQAALVQQNAGAVTTDRANVDAAQLNLSYCRIIAAVAGRAGLRQIDPGNNVNAGASTGLVVITQIDPIDVVFTVPEDDVPRIVARQRTGATLTASVLDRANSNVLAQGALLTLDNQIDVATGTIKAKARFANASEALIANQFVNVRLLVDMLQDAVIVPASAIRHGPNGDFVWILTAQRTAQMRPVTVGPAVGEQASIANGVAVGETVITEGGDNLRDGAPVSLPGHPAPSSGRGQRGAHRGQHRRGGQAQGAAP